MPAPTESFYAAAVLVDAQQSFLDRVDGGTGAGKVFLYDEADNLLAEIPLTDPAGTIDAGGVLTITPSGPDTSANATGTCSWGTICDSDDTVCLTLRALQAAAPAAGYLVLNDANIIAGTEVTLSSCVIGG